MNHSWYELSRFSVCINCAEIRETSNENQACVSMIFKHVFYNLLKELENESHKS